MYYFAGYINGFYVTITGTEQGTYIELVKDKERENENANSTD